MHNLLFYKLKFMNKSFLTLMVICFGLLYVYPQQDSITIFQVQYERTLTIDDNPNPLISIYEYTKFIEFEKSIFKKKSKASPSSNLIEVDDTGNIYFTPSKQDISVVFKDYEKYEYFINHEIAFKYFVVKDSLEIFNWNILDNKKEVLGFKCQLATMSFRGREYEAWFATELPVGGPWKYDGLPGIILEIKSVDNFISFKARSITNGKLKLDNLENPFNTKNVLSWNDFKSLYKKKAIEMLSYKPYENSGGFVMSRNGIEYYIDKDDEEYTNALEKRSAN